MKSQPTLKDLINYAPYSIARRKDSYADIAFEDEGAITVPLQSASTIVDLLNTAFNNGVRKTLSTAKSDPMKVQRSQYDEPVFIPKQMPQEEPVAINSYTKKKK